MQTYDEKFIPKNSLTKIYRAKFITFKLASSNLLTAAVDSLAKLIGKRKSCSGESPAKMLNR